MVLEGTAGAAPRKVTKRRAKTTVRESQEKIDRKIDSSNRSEQAKALLHELNENLHSGTRLRTLKQVKKFAEENSMRAIRARSRARGVEQLVMQLTELDIETLKQIAKLLTKMDGPAPDRSLEQWSDIILGPPRE